MRLGMDSAAEYLLLITVVFMGGIFGGYGLIRFYEWLKGD